MSIGQGKQKRHGSTCFTYDSKRKLTSDQRKEMANLAFRSNLLVPVFKSSALIVIFPGIPLSVYALSQATAFLISHQILCIIFLFSVAHCLSPQNPVTRPTSNCLANYMNILSEMPRINDTAVHVP